jgi:hypothetical protein
MLRVRAATARTTAGQEARATIRWVTTSRRAWTPSGQPAGGRRYGSLQLLGYWKRLQAARDFVCRVLVVL